MSADVESYLNQLVGRMAMIRLRGGEEMFLNVLALSTMGLLVQDREDEYFVPWSSVVLTRLARDSEITKVGSPELRKRRRRPILDSE